MNNRTGEGTATANLLTQFNDGVSLDSKFLSQLLDGLRFLEAFNRGIKFSPETIYYSTKVEQIERMLENRRLSPK